MDLIHMARETIQITKQGWYEKAGRRIPLVGAPFPGFSDVIVLDTDRLTAIQNDDDEFFERSFCGSEGCQFFLLNADSFEAARELDHPLVMNFANSITPGGGFLHGARAQEESLCRASTLYISISSEPAMEMYRYNRRNPSPVDSDYMLLSPNVCVFRGTDGTLLDKPYAVSVFTIPAPNKRGLARLASQEELDRVMTDRLRKFLLAAARHGYRDLVLGAWGCGAFGHDAERVAGYFHTLFFEEDLTEYFDTVVFAILGDEGKLDAFAKVFGDAIIDCRADQSPAKKQYLEAASRFPVCNHTTGVTSDNLGYTQGIMLDGMPFEAELWADRMDVNLAVVIPETKASPELLPHEPLVCGNVTGFHNTVSCSDGSVLCVGMVDRGEDVRAEMIQGYVKKLEDAGLVRFTTAARNGSVRYVTDENGTDLAQVIVALTVDGDRLAFTQLHFKKFLGDERPEGKLIPFWSAVNGEEKSAAYEALVRDVSACPKLDSCNRGLLPEKQLEKCPDCDEVNLWSYWQGGREHLDAKILLVGQDWGCYRPGFTLGAQRKTHPDHKFYYRECDGSKGSETDRTLCELFAELGYDISTDGDNDKYPGNVRELFFTNFVLCYRCGNVSGCPESVWKVWQDNCSEYFRRLVQIIQPQVILCLGQAVYNSVASVAGCSEVKRDYSCYVEGGPKQMVFGGVSSWVFPLFHPGNYGILNRGGHDKNEGKRLQLEDWRRVKVFLDKLSI